MGKRKIKLTQQQKNKLRHIFKDIATLGIRALVRYIKRKRHERKNRLK